MDVPISENPGNSNRAKKGKNYNEKAAKGKSDDSSTGEVDKKVVKVVTGDVIKRKTPLAQRFKNLFFTSDFPGVTRYLTQEVLLPSLRNLIVDSTTKGIERMIYGDVQPTRRYGSDPRTRYSYNNPVSRDSRRRVMLPDQPPHPPPRNKSIDVGDIILSSREDADHVLERLADIIDQYQAASVADLYELVGVQTSYTDNKWGWTELIYADVKQVREGFLIQLPPADPV